MVSIYDMSLVCLCHVILSIIHHVFVMSIYDKCLVFLYLMIISNICCILVMYIHSKNNGYTVLSDTWDADIVQFYIMCVVY